MTDRHSNWAHSSAEDSPHRTHPPRSPRLLSDNTTKDADTRYNLGFRNCVHLLTQNDRKRQSVRNAAEKGANMDVGARPLTKWGPHGPPRLLSHKWMQEVVSFWSQHSLDHVDVKAVKNAECGVDMLHHNVGPPPALRTTPPPAPRTPRPALQTRHTPRAAPDRA